MRIAPPEAPKTGYLFGKGVYFADMIGKSQHYCRAEVSRGVATLVLCEVACGKARLLKHHDIDADKLPKGFDSIKACGSTEPNPKISMKLDKNILVPYGEALKLDPRAKLGANEYVVYNTN